MYLELHLELELFVALSSLHLLVSGWVDQDQDVFIVEELLQQTTTETLNKKNALFKSATAHETIFQIFQVSFDC